MLPVYVGCNFKLRFLNPAINAVQLTFVTVFNAMEKTEKAFEGFCLIFPVTCFRGMKTLLTLTCDLNVFTFRDFYLFVVFLCDVIMKITNISEVLVFIPRGTNMAAVK